MGDGMSDSTARPHYDPNCAQAYADGVEAGNKELEELRAAVREHRDQRGDDRCFLDDYKLYEHLPEGLTEEHKRLLACTEPDVMLANCKRYIEHRRDPSVPYVNDYARGVADERARCLAWAEHADDVGVEQETTMSYDKKHFSDPVTVQPNYGMQTDFVADRVWDLIRMHPTVAATHEGEDSAGRARLRLQTPKELVDRCFEITKLYFERAEAEGRIRLDPLTREERSAVSGDVEMLRDRFAWGDQDDRKERIATIVESARKKLDGE